MCYLLAVSLSPLMLLQALWVKGRTPRLAEPMGARRGELGAGMALRLLIIGDSAAAGVGARSQRRALSGCLSDELRRHYRLHWTLLARSGLTTRQTISALSGGEWASYKRQTFDVVLVSLGVNDVLSPLTARAWLASVGELVALLRQVSPQSKIILTQVPPLEKFSTFPQPLAWFLGTRRREFNRQLAALCVQSHGCDMLEVPFPATVNALASDGVHPSETTYLSWAQVASARIRRLFPAN